MKDTLVLKQGFGAKHYCKLTDKLNEYLEGCHDWYKVYVHAYENEYDVEGFALRIPGRTIGSILLNPDKTIKEISICSDCLGYFTVDNINDYIQDFIGCKLVFERGLSSDEEEKNSI